MKTKNTKPTIHVPYLSSIESTNTDVDRNLDFLSAQGLRIVGHKKNRHRKWPYTAGTIKQRVSSLTKALSDPNCKYILCARGGYGCSDILPYIPWETLNKNDEKIVIGFSDITALQSAVYSKLGWKSLHAPMPASSLWKNNPNKTDTSALLKFIKSEKSSGTLDVSLAYPKNQKDPIEGWLFGGCLVVITNLIGTPYFPRSLKGSIIFVEDIDENPAHYIRNLNQWHQTGLLEGVQGIVFGFLADCFPKNFNPDWFYKEVYERYNIPVLHTEDFGHLSPNLPVMIGARSKIHKGEWLWSGV